MDVDPRVKQHCIRIEPFNKHMLGRPSGKLCGVYGEK
jgi:hypothetical protein